MIDNGGRAALQRFDGTEHRRPFHHFEVELNIEPPPDVLKYFEEAGWLFGRGWHTAGERGIEMVMTTHHSRRYGTHHSSTSAVGFIGNEFLHRPSTCCSIAATAPEVGTKPISPTPLMP